MNIYFMRRKQAVTILFVLIFCTGSCLSSCLVNKLTPDGKMKSLSVSGQNWYEMYDQERKIGYLRYESRDLTFEDRPAREIRTRTYKRFKRFGVEIEETYSGIFLFRKDFRPIFFRVRDRVSREERTLEGSVRNGTMKVVEKISDYRVVRNFKLDDDITFLETLDGKILEAGLKAGKSLRFKVFDTQLQKITAVEVDIVRESEIEIENKFARVFLLSMRHRDYPRIEMLTWMAPDGTIIREEASQLGIKSQLTSRENAENMSFTADLGYLSMIRTSSRVSHARQATNATLEAYFSRGNLREMLEFPPLQRTFPSGNADQLTLETQAFRANAARSLLIPVKDPEMKPFLEPNIFIQSDDPEIKKQAAMILGRENNAVRSAEKLARWVYGNIREKNLSTGFASARETMRTRSGDCTEHSILLAALARSAGIPARVISGLVYVTGNFLYHMWVEVFTGSWQPLDPSLGPDMVDALHIKIYAASMDPASYFLSGLSIQQTVGNLGLKILRYSAGGKDVTVYPNDPGYNIKGSLYQDTVYGFGIEMGKGWEVETPAGMPSVLAGFVNRPAMSSITVSVEELTSPHSYPLLLGEISRQIEGEKDIQAVSFKRGLKFKGRPAARIVFVKKQPMVMALVPVEVSQLVILEKNLVYIVSSIVPRNSPGSISREVLKMVESFMPSQELDAPR